MGGEGGGGAGELVTYIGLGEGRFLERVHLYEELQKLVRKELAAHAV